MIASGRMCDKCSGSAKFLVFHAKDEDDAFLAFCGHHYRKVEDAIARDPMLKVRKVGGTDTMDTMVEVTPNVAERELTVAEERAIMSLVETADSYLVLISKSSALAAAGNAMEQQRLNLFCSGGLPEPSKDEITSHLRRLYGEDD